MNKLEFSQALSRTIEKIGTDLTTAKARYEEIKSDPTQQTEKNILNYQISLLNAKYKALLGHLDLPIKARIKTMSSAEFQAFRDEKVNELNTKAKKILEERDRTETRVSELTKESEELKLKQSKSVEERKRAFFIGDEISASTNLLKHQNLALFNIQSEKDLYFSGTVEDIIHRLLPDYDIKNYALAAPTDYDVNPILLAVANDPQKAIAFQKLLREWEATLNAIRKGYSVEKVPFPYAKRKYNSRSKALENVTEGELKDLIKIVDNEISSINSSLEKIPEVYAAKREIINKIKQVNANSLSVEDIDLDFIKSYLGKTDQDDDLKKVVDAISEYNKLSRKLFKTKNDKWEMDRCKRQISITGQVVYYGIEKYENGEMAKAIGNEYAFTDQAKTEDYYKSRLDDLMSFRHGLASALEEAKANKAKQEELVEKIETLTGIKDIDREIITQTNSYYVNNDMINSATNDEVNRVTKQVMEESKALSDRAENKILRKDLPPIETGNELVDSLQSLKEQGISLTDSQQRLLDISGKLNSDKFNFYATKLTSGEFEEYQEKREERARRQEETRNSIAKRNAEVEERLSREDSQTSGRIAKLEEYKKQLSTLGKLKETYPTLLSDEQNAMLDNGTEFFRMMEEADKDKHEIDTGMSPEVRDWYQNAYSNEESPKKTM